MIIMLDAFETRRAAKRQAFSRKVTVCRPIHFNKKASRNFVVCSRQSRRSRDCDFSGLDQADLIERYDLLTAERSAGNLTAMNLWEIGYLELLLGPEGRYEAGLTKREREWRRRFDEQVTSVHSLIRDPQLKLVGGSHRPSKPIESDLSMANVSSIILR